MFNFVDLYRINIAQSQSQSKSAHGQDSVVICLGVVPHDLSNIPDSKVHHYDDVIMTMLASQITSLTVVYSIVYSDVNQRKHQSSASLAFVREIHRGPVNFPHKWPVTRKMFPFDDVIMWCQHGAHLGPTGGPRWAPCWPHAIRDTSKLSGIRRGYFHYNGPMLAK